MRNEDIYNEAKDIICKEWGEKLKNATDNELAKMFFDGSDWALENDFPTVELLKKHSNVEQFGLVFTSSNKPIVGEHLAFFGSSRNTVNCNGFQVVEIFARHNSEIEVNVSDNAIVRIDVFDKAKVIINDNGANKTKVIYR